MKRTINNERRFKQQLLFEGTERGKICFTDIDFVMEIKNHSLIIGECKVKNNPITIGQKLLLQRFCDKEWKNSIAVVVEHDTPIDIDVKLQDTIVREYYKDHVWNNVIDRKIKFIDFYDKLCESWNVKELIKEKA